MRLLWWTIAIMTILATPTTLAHGIWLLLGASESRPESVARLWTWAVQTGFCIFFISLGLKIISSKIEPPDEHNRDQAASPPRTDKKIPGQS